MQTVLIVIHFLIVIALIGVVLIQPSEGGGLGVSSGSGFMGTRGAKSALTRLTAILATCFFAVSITLVVIGSISNSGSDILDRIPMDLKKNSTNKGEIENIPSSKEETGPSIFEQLGGASSQKAGSSDSAVESPIPLPLDNTK
ncbi:preprotein translocase subunit SecG [Bartonella ancashensis]|uniref:Protein-export membrane protein SecG n=1 Tax=Bartonella ancashensis TaxID=1318743 RepID=A0A0M4LH70_9HYPH|nr:preprotein translocase subunit SecG [Bartonella ancashensis]ALE03944.1 Preprotein translocase subunit SecG [Bartonella ancashensis]